MMGRLLEDKGDVGCNLPGGGGRVGTPPTEERPVGG